MAYLTRTINPAQGPLQQAVVDKHYQRKHGKDAYYGQE
jgi:L-ribulose-5-phosphate 4-epimerase